MSTAEPRPATTRASHPNGARRVALLCLLLAAFLSLATAAHAASATPATGMQVRIPDAEVKVGDRFSLPVTVDRTGNLAGLKLVLRYDPALLRFTRLDKSAVTAPLMHVVNDKTPGRLIVVMAGARGVKGKDFPLAILHFTALKAGRSAVTIEQWEFMADTLKPVTATIHSGTISVSQGEHP